jgi:hypothetical protein
MASADERAARIKRDRRHIVAALRQVYPGWLKGEELFLCILDLNPEYDRRLLVKDLNYLSEKGYVAWKGNEQIDEPNISVKRCAFKATALGTELADKLVKDPTMEV